MENSVYRKLTLSFILLFSTVLFAKVGLAAQITLAWDANTESDVAGYKIYYGTSSKSYSGSVDVGNVTNYHLTGLKGGQTYYVSITAYSTSRSESSYSGEVSGVATEPTPPVSETPPTVSTTPTSEPTTSSETTPRQTQSPPSDTAGRGGAGGCTRETRASTSETKYIGTHLYIAVSEVSAAGPSIGNIKKYEVSTGENPTNPTNSSNSSNSSNSIRLLRLGEFLMPARLQPLIPITL